MDRRLHPRAGRARRDECQQRLGRPHHDPQRRHRNTAATSPQIHNTAATLAYSLVEGDCPAGATCGAGILASAPQFIAPIAASSASTTTGDYRLQAGSPAIDAGHRLSVTVATDLDGAARIQGCTVDMGAYEAGPLACLGAAKQVTPTTDVAYLGVVTYTLILSNTGDLTDTAILTDALPAQVIFGGWLANPGATQTAGQITWSGTITPAAALTYIFTATHTGAADIAVTNTALL